MYDNRLRRTRRGSKPGELSESLHPQCKCPARKGLAGSICANCAGAIPTEDELILLGKAKVVSSVTEEENV